jgi:hypothetical protein
VGVGVRRCVFVRIQTVFYPGTRGPVAKLDAVKVDCFNGLVVRVCGVVLRVGSFPVAE